MRIITLMLGLAMGLSTNAETTADAVGMVNQFKGEVVVHRSGGDDIKVGHGLELKEGDVVEAKAGAAAQLVMKDSNVFVVGENSKLELKNYYFKNPQGASTFLLDGDLHSNVKNKSKDDKPNFRIVSPGGVIGIRGTEFLTEAHGKTLKVTTFAGVVEMGDSLEGRSVKNSVIVEKGFQFLGSPGKYEGKAAYLVDGKQLQKLQERSNPWPEKSGEKAEAELKKADSGDKNAKDKKSSDTKEEPAAKKPEHVK